MVPCLLHLPLTIRLVACATLLIISVLVPLSGRADVRDTKGVEQVIAAAREAGVSIVVVDGAPAPGTALPEAQVPLPERAAEIAHKLAANLARVSADLASARESLPATIAAASPTGNGSWPWMALLVTTLSLAVGWLFERVIGRFVDLRLVSPQPSSDAPRSERIRFVLVNVVAEGLAIAAGLAIALLLAVSVIGNATHHRTVILAVFEAVAYVRASLLFCRAVLTPNARDVQFLSIPPEASAQLYARLRYGLWLAGCLAAAALWLARIDAAGGLVFLSAVLASGATALVLGQAAWRLHRAIGEGNVDGSGRASWLTRNWHVVAVIYLSAAVVTTFVGQLLGAKTSGIVIAPVTAAILAASVYTVLLLFIDAKLGPPGPSEDSGLPSFRRWAERSALVVASSIAATVVLGAWGVDFFRADGSVRPVYTILLISIAAYIGWAAIRTAFDRRTAQEAAVAGPEADDGEGGGTGRSRLGTLLPVFRNAILIAILVIVLMVVLSSIGVDIAPLFAGAGLVGFAIGFGSQTLVRDIFSGVFFLLDDAFRVGEYIDTGGAKGTVEKISIRSMQLRHQNGPLHTIPFGEIKQLTNFSRDWVIMKLPIRVRFGTDTERVRKLIKKLGQELLEHPDIGHHFVEPLKSQGVYQMDEFGIVTRVKFKTKPGNQFVVRKVVYQKINELFEREGIAFGGREVIVRAADDGQHGKVSLDAPEVAGAAAAAAQVDRTGTP